MVEITSLDLCVCYTAFDLDQDKYQTDTQQDMANPSNARDRCTHPR